MSSNSLFCFLQDPITQKQDTHQASIKEEKGVSDTSAMFGRSHLFPIPTVFHERRIYWQWQIHLTNAALRSKLLDVGPGSPGSGGTPILIFLPRSLLSLWYYRFRWQPDIQGAFGTIYWIEKCGVLCPMLVQFLSYLNLSDGERTRSRQWHGIVSWSSSISAMRLCYQQSKRSWYIAN